MSHMLPHSDGYFRALGCALMLSVIALVPVTPAVAQEAPAEDAAPSAPDDVAPTPEAVTPQEAAPEETPPGEVAPQEAAPEEVAPQEAAPEEAAPEEAAPEEAAPEEIVPDEAAPAEATPEEVEPEEAAPEEIVPDEAAPAEAAEEGTESETNQPWSLSAPCENYQHPYEADLCQQWRAAEAAERTAGLARLLMLIGAAATLLLLLMFVPLLMAVRAARRAASGAAVPASGSTREQELRAYVDVDKLEFIETPESEGMVKVKVLLRNTGQTPAFQVKSAVEVGIRDISDEDLLPIMRLPERSSLDSARPRLGRDATATDIVSCESTAALADRVMSGDATILVWGVVEYSDVFDRKHKTAFQYLCNADTLDTGQVFKPMVRGDEDG